MSDDDFDLYEQFVRLEWLIRRYQLQNLREFGPMANPHKGQGRVLALLKLKPEISQKELSSILDIRSQSLGELLGKLERSGYITRTPSEKDRRAMDICLTEAGRAAANQTEEQSDGERIFGCLGEDERAALNAIFEKLTDNLDRQFREAEKEFSDGEERGGFPFEREGFPFGREGSPFGREGSPFGREGFDPRLFFGGGKPKDK